MLEVQNVTKSIRRRAVRCRSCRRRRCRSRQATPRRSWDHRGAARARCSTSSARSSRRRRARSRSTAGIRSSSRRRRSRRSATSRSASSSRITACCRSAPSLENVLIPTLVASGATTTTTRARARELDRAGRAGRSRGSPSGGAFGRRAPARRDRARAHPRSRGCCSATSRPAISIARRPTTSRPCCSICTGASRRSSIIVTHSPQLAERCPIRFELTDNEADAATLRGVALTTGFGDRLQRRA